MKYAAAQKSLSHQFIHFPCLTSKVQSTTPATHTPTNQAQSVSVSILRDNEDIPKRSHHAAPSPSSHVSCLVSLPIKGYQILKRKRRKKKTSPAAFQAETLPSHLAGIFFFGTPSMIPVPVRPELGPSACFALLSSRSLVFSARPAYTNEGGC